MAIEIVDLVRQQVASAVRRAAAPVAFALIGLIFVLFTVAGLFAALFFWLEPERGPVAASLICSGVALALAIVSALPLLFRRSKPPPPPQTDDMLPRFIGLMARSAPGFAPRQLIVTAALVGAVLFVTARGASKRETG
jgi:hypothetical protein